MNKKLAVIDKNFCVACGCCLSVCKKGAINIISGSYAKVDKELCVGCGLCKKECPASVISFERVAL